MLGEGTVRWVKGICLTGFAALSGAFPVVPGSLQPRQEPVVSALLCLVAELAPKNQGCPGTYQAKPSSLLAREWG